MTFRMIALALAVALAGPALANGPDNRTQLERSIGIPKEEAGRYSNLQLAMMKRIMERSDLSRQDREFRIETIKRGRSPLLSTNF